jgi:hypothetical protein
MNHGGKRTGAGRKPVNRKRILYARVSEKTYTKINNDAKKENKSISEYLDWLLAPL